LHQILLLDSFHHVQAHEAYERLQRDLHGVLPVATEQQGCWPAQLNYPDDPNDPTPAPSSSSGAVLALLILGQLPDDNEDAPPLPEMVDWMDQHRLTVLGAATALVALAIIALTLVFHWSSRLPGSSLKALTGLAECYYIDQDYEKAIDLYNQVLDNSGNLWMVHARLAAAYYHTGDLPKAEHHYLAALRAGGSDPSLMLNLGLTLYEQGKIEDAMRCYQTIAEKHPQMRRRARLASQLIQQNPNI
jgi:tetratricopeptide (TPR) repeat protein